MRGAGPVPADHDCAECGCVFPDHGWHQTKTGLCLACGGCGDPQCCGGHDDDCRFENTRLCGNCGATIELDKQHACAAVSAGFRSTHTEREDG